MFFFFFSSRRRHTRCSRDWSSDVCSSDLPFLLPAPPLAHKIKMASRRAKAASRGFPRVTNHERSEEHTSELQSRLHLVCRLLLEKKKNNRHTVTNSL